MNLRLDEEWEILGDQSVVRLRVSEVFARLWAGQVKPSHHCRKGDGPWQAVSEHFQLLGPYGLLCEIGTGSFGAVLKALDLKGNRVVAVKRPTCQLSGDERELAARAYAEEARLTSCLATNPHVVKLLSFDITVPYLVLTYCEDGSLRQMMEQGGFSAANVVKWGHTIACVLREAHELRPDKVVHRDLKPGNILFSKGSLLVADFGGAMMVRETVSPQTMLPYGFTPAYAAPECFERGTRLPAAADIWSLGVILWELITGTLPFRSADLEELVEKIRDAPLPAVPPVRPGLGPVPADLLALLRRCLAKDPEARPTARECAGKLAEIEEGLGMQRDWTPTVPIGVWVATNAEKLYKTNLAALRELLQNAVDAVRMSDDPQKSQTSIRISYDEGNKRLVVHDCGIGMSMDDQQKCFWTPGMSRKKHVPEDERRSRHIIGEFGIGAYAAFKIAQTVHVASRPEGDAGAAVQGTCASLGKPLRDYSRAEVPDISFRSLSAQEAAECWGPDRPHGTTVVLDLVDPLNTAEAQKWLETECVFLKEDVCFNDSHVNRDRESMSGPSGDGVQDVDAEVCSDHEARQLCRLQMKMRLKEGEEPAIELGSATGTHDGQRVECRGLVRLSAPGSTRGVLILKHGFPLERIKDTASFAGYPRTLKFDGYLDLPFVRPTLARDSFDDNSENEVKALLLSMSWALVEEVAERSPGLLCECPQLFDAVFGRKLEDRLRILAKYPLRIRGSDERTPLQNLRDRKDADPDLNVVFLRESAPENVRSLADTLSRLDDYCVVEIEGPEYWRGCSLENTLEQGLGAQHLATHPHHLHILDEKEALKWKDYHAELAAVLDGIIGSGRQLKLAKIEPEEIKIEIAETSNKVYLNCSNRDVASLLDDPLVGTDLERKLREWLYGQTEARQMEEMLVQQGALLVVQEIKELRVVSGPDVADYTPASNDLFLRLAEGAASRYCLRVSRYCRDKVLDYIQKLEGRWGWLKLQPAYRARLNWVGAMFHFVLMHNDPQSPWYVLTFKANTVLANPDMGNAMEGSVACDDFAVAAFAGAESAEADHFFYLPRWIGEAFEEKLRRKGALPVSFTAELAFPRSGG